MKKLFIVANWKSNKTIKDTEKWLHDFDEELKLKQFSFESKEIIIAPTFTLLEHANYCSSNLKLPIKFGAQDISSFEEGAYTGEVNGRQIKELASYVIVGHSERRKWFDEDYNVINHKIEETYDNSLIPIFCISKLDQIDDYPYEVNPETMVIAYEPLFAIGTGNPDNPENADSMGKKIKEILGEVPVLYGGSVTSDNVKSFTCMPHIDGVLVGGASLDPLEFLKIIQNA